jgi:peptide/nickel transport system permease protein
VALVRPGESPLEQPKELILPALTLLATSLAWTTRLVRAAMIEALGSEPIEQARLNGFSERRVVWRYGLRSALAPTVQVFAQAIQYLVGGVIVTEVVFAYNGLGKELVDAVAVRDVRAVQSMAMLIAVVYITINIIADLLVVLLVPRLRTAAR